MYTNEEKDLLKAARLLNTYCKQITTCDDCIFSIEDGFDCALSGECDEWDLLSEDEEDY